MKKPRKDRRIHQLTEEQQCQLAEWLLGGMGYLQAAALCEKEFGVSIGKNALAQFYHEICTPAVLARRARAARMASAVAAECQRQPGQFDPATIELVQQKAFEVAADPNARPEALRDLLHLVLKIRDQNLAEKKLQLDTEKLQLELRKYMDAVESARREINAVKAAGGIAPETLKKVEEALNLL